ncbi:hypothetical protein LCGC14_1416660 [marine sediment metagenome]|uniref:Thioredoxin domain-containing protein n=1 Tax=marine sediment metagenome TaxID=412755 RepID=A0A0F9M858_9ZZZZ
MAKLIPCLPVPELKVQTTDGTVWNLFKQTPDNFTMVVFYRGFHCPICKKYLIELQSKLTDFIGLGVHVIAISGDTDKRALETKKKWGLENLMIGFGISIEEARKWGLFISKRIDEKEPDIFIEPGLFLIKPDGTLYASIISTMPFVRPSFREILSSIDIIVNNDYPARGEA